MSPPRTGAHAQRDIRFEITTDPARLPPETTWELMTNLPGKIERTVGSTFGLRAWIACGFKQAKDALDWADDRLINAASIERWWEVVRCAYLLVGRQAPAFASTARADILGTASATATPALQHPDWTDDASWEHRLNNVRLVLPPFICACALLPWLYVYPLPHLTAGLADLCALMNTDHPLLPI